MQLQQGRNIDSSIHAETLQQAGAILGGNISSCARRKGASAQSTERGIEASHTGLDGSNSIFQSHAAGIVKMCGERDIFSLLGDLG